MDNLIAEIDLKRKVLEDSITELRKQGDKKAESEANYRQELAKKILFERAKGTPVTIISDICRGDKFIAPLKQQRDIDISLYEALLQKIHASKLEIKILDNQIAREWHQ